MSKPLRDERGRVLPGHSLNPRGRPPTGLAFHETARRVMGARDGALSEAFFRLCLRIALGVPVCRDPEWLRRWAAAIERGEPEPPEPESGAVEIPSLDHMDDARKFLAQWAFERVPERVDATSGGEQVSSVGVAAPRSLSVDDLRALAQIKQKLLPPSG